MIDILSAEFLVDRTIDKRWWNDCYLLEYKNREDISLKVHEYLADERDDLEIYDVLGFVSHGRLVKMIVKPISKTLLGLSPEKIVGRLSGGALRRFSDYETVVNQVAEYANMEKPAREYHLYRYYLRDLINQFDPLGIGAAPIDEYNDLVADILLKFFREWNKTIDRTVLQTMIRDYSSMDIHTEPQVREVTERIRETFDGIADREEENG
jgi:hypothetical protein